MDKPMRTKVADYIDKAIEASKKDGEDDFSSNGSTPANGLVRDRLFIVRLLISPHGLGRNQTRLIFMQTTKSSIPINSQVAVWICPK